MTEDAQGPSLELESQYEQTENLVSRAEESPLATVIKQLQQ